MVWMMQISARQPLDALTIIAFARLASFARSPSTSICQSQHRMQSPRTQRIFTHFLFALTASSAIWSTSMAPLVGAEDGLEDAERLMAPPFGQSPLPPRSAVGDEESMASPAKSS